MILSLAFLALNTGCTGDKGEDGDLYIAIDWNENEQPDFFNDDNEATPYTITPGENYKTDEGTFEYSYRIGSSSWTDTYTLEADDGEDGSSFWKDGDNGHDSYYTLWLMPGGPELDKTMSLQKDSYSLEEIEAGESTGSRIE